LAGQIEERDFSEIINDTKGIVLSAIEKNLSPRFSHAIDDVAQETYLRAYKSLTADKFRGESALSTWLYTIARNESLRMNKKLAREEEKAQKSGLYLIKEQEEAHSRDEEDLDILKNKISLLPEKYRDILSMMTTGKNIKEIAEKLNIRPGTVKSRASRGRKMLKDIIMEDIK